MRTCELCGAGFPDTDTILSCDRPINGTYCGGKVWPRPEPVERTSACLVCLDSGIVEMADGTTRRCPRGCGIKGREQ